MRQRIRSGRARAASRMALAARKRAQLVTQKTTEIQKSLVLQGSDDYSLSEVWGVHSLTPKTPSLELGLHFTVCRQLCVNQF